jgi:hypothetical protein
MSHLLKAGLNSYHSVHGNRSTKPKSGHVARFWFMFCRLVSRYWPIVTLDTSASGGFEAG